MEATSCSSLLQELQVLSSSLMSISSRVFRSSSSMGGSNLEWNQISSTVLWDEIGETDHERDRMILRLEQDCLNVYRKKVDQERKHKSDLVQALSEGEAEIAKIISVLGDQGNPIPVGKQGCTLKEQVSKIEPMLDDLRRKREERVKEFFEVQSQILQICTELSGSTLPSGSACPQIDERDLTLKRLGELKFHLLELQKEKDTKLQKASANIKTINELCSVLSLDFGKMLHEVHPIFADAGNIQLRSISNETLAPRTGSMLTELWNLMDIDMYEQNKYNNVTSLMSASSADALDHGSLAMDVINQAELEVERLNILKATKMKELVLKKQNELEEIYRGVHMEFDFVAARQKIINNINSG
ncbi:65-kDa microtubule-associated protein 1 [Platanthera zijinensis]|uniref:65-kDa microtubule-associated protein 1 n=1 Tax=Platanthera zijinensis TaxID=2320716 RepID=A0AAP0AZ47_9ASPA